jgi:hypothetical protein
MTAGPRRSSGRDEQMFGDEQQIPHEVAIGSDEQMFGAE